MDEKKQLDYRKLSRAQQEAVISVANFDERRGTSNKTGAAGVNIGAAKKLTQLGWFEMFRPMFNDTDWYRLTPAGRAAYEAATRGGKESGVRGQGREGVRDQGLGVREEQELGTRHQGLATNSQSLTPNASPSQPAEPGAPDDFQRVAYLRMDEITELTRERDALRAQLAACYELMRKVRQEMRKAGNDLNWDPPLTLEYANAMQAIAYAIGDTDLLPADWYIAAAARQEETAGDRD